MKGKYKFVHSTLTALFLFLKRAIIKRYTDYYSMFDTNLASHILKKQNRLQCGMSQVQTLHPTCTQGLIYNCGDSAAFKFPRKWLDKNVFSGKVYTV